jgi:hypothetical protein
VEKCHIADGDSPHPPIRPPLKIPTLTRVLTTLKGNAGMAARLLGFGTTRGRSMPTSKVCCYLGYTSCASACDCRASSSGQRHRREHRGAGTCNRRTCLIASRGVTQRPKPCGCLTSDEGQCKMDMQPILVLLGAAIGIAILAVLQWRIVNDARSFVQRRSGFGWSVQKKPRSTRGYDVCVARESIGARGGAVRPKRISILRPQSRARTISRVGVDARPRT